MRRWSLRGGQTKGHIRVAWATLPSHLAGFETIAVNQLMITTLYSIMKVKKRVWISYATTSQINWKEYGLSEERRNLRCISLRCLSYTLSLVRRPCRGLGPPLLANSSTLNSKHDDNPRHQQANNAGYDGIYKHGIQIIVT